MKYARRLGPNNWAIEQAATGAGGHLALALDANGLPAVLYADASSDVLRYVRKVGGVWIAGSAPAVGNEGTLWDGHANVEYDTAGALHACYVTHDHSGSTNAAILRHALLR